MKHILFLFFIAVFFSSKVEAQFKNKQNKFSLQDTLRGSIGIGRQKWDVLKYDITVEPDINKKTISGCNAITFMDSGVHQIQIDLQEPMIIDSVLLLSAPIPFVRDQNMYWVTINSSNDELKNYLQKKTVKIYFHGKPKIARNPPWDGGWIWEKDANKNPFISVACQGLGASVWYPCKDIQSDEPNDGCSLNIIVPDSLMAISNGRLLKTSKYGSSKTLYSWLVTAPINNYNIVPYIGKYTHLQDSFQGLKGKLDLDYWVLSDHAQLAIKQFKDVKKMLTAFEYWFGPYPFYEDGYKLVEAPHLGMEHQSAIAYGNKFRNGYLGIDLSGSGWGLKWDFIIVHESGHEWFANNITTADIADMWVHEGFTCYSETLFTEYYFGKEAADSYLQGLRKNIINDEPIIGPYGVNKEGSGDMYYKSANMLHTIRQIINDDKKFRALLIGMNEKFYHSIVTTSEIESFINHFTQIDFSKIFNQYLRTTKIPTLEYYTNKRQLFYRWSNCVEGFNMEIKLQSSKKWLSPTTNWKQVKYKNSNPFRIDSNFYITTKMVENHL
jgi:aminopeptidase N